MFNESPGDPHPAVRALLTPGAEQFQSATSPLDRSGPNPVQEGSLVRSVLGLDTPAQSQSTLPLQAIVQGAKLTLEQQQVLNSLSPKTGLSYEAMLAKVHQEAKIAGRDVGLDLQKILPELINQPELLERLYSVATASELLSVKVADDRRREFLSEVIVMAADKGFINQGHTSFCTITDQLGDTSTANVINLFCDLAVNCQAESQSGLLVLAGKGSDRSSRERDIKARIIPFSEQRSGLCVNSSAESTLQLQQLGARQPGVITTALLACLMEISGQDVTKSAGQKWGDFTRSRQVIEGHQVVCAAYDARIPVDKDGKPVWCHSENKNGNGQQDPSVTSDRQLSLVEYVDCTLDRKAKEGAASAIAGISVNMRWGDAQPDSGQPSRHGCHTLSIVSKKVDASGQVWYVLDNPVGDYYQPAEPGQPQRRYPPGTELGNKNATWWRVGEQRGLVEVRADVLKESLIHLMVDHPDRKLSDIGAVEDIKLYTLGSVNGNTTGNAGVESSLVNLPTHEPKLGEAQITSKSTDSSPVLRKFQVTDAKITVGEELAKQALEQRLAALADASPSVNRGGAVGQRSSHAAYRDPKEILQLAELPDSPRQVRWIPGRDGEPFILGFSKIGASSDTTSAVVSGSTPPPAPQHSPQDLARQLSLRQRTFDSVA